MIRHFELSVGLTAWRVADRSGAERFATEPLCLALQNGRSVYKTCGYSRSPASFPVNGQAGHPLGCWGSFSSLETAALSHGLASQAHLPQPLS